MIIPNFVHDKVVDGEGNLTPQWIMFFTQLLDQMQLNLSNEGFVIPTLSSEHTMAFPLGQLVVVAPTAANGTMIYDSFTDQLKVRLSDGNFHVIQTV